MIHPTPEAIIRTVIKSIDEVLRPGLTRALAEATPDTLSQDKLHLSAVVTIRHMLQFAVLRLAANPALFDAEVVRLDDLLAEAAPLIARLHPARDNALLADLQLLRTRRPDGADGRVADAALGEFIVTQRDMLHRVLQSLSRNRAALEIDPAYAGCREAIRIYIAWQLQAESALIDEAMAGPDVRR